MSTTPRTDAFSERLTGSCVPESRCFPHWFGFARKLERELAASHQREAALRDALQFYADGQHYEYINGSCGNPGHNRILDEGEVAEAALQPAAVTVIDLDRSSWDAIKEAASQSKWMPPEYMMNDWVSDVCQWLRDGVTTGYVRREVLQQCVDAVALILEGSAEDVAFDEIIGYSFCTNSVIHKHLTAALAAAKTELGNQPA